MIYKLDFSNATPLSTRRSRLFSGWYSASDNSSSVVPAGANFQNPRLGGTKGGSGMFGLLVSSHIRGRWY